jgi:hypothetical protein
MILTSKKKILSLTFGQAAAAAKQSVSATARQRRGNGAATARQRRGVTQ